jgi:hypothetical protein
MQQPHPTLIAALAAAPRRYRMPPLPATAEAATARGLETALAFAIEAARPGGPTARPPAGMRDFFTHSLAAVIRDAMARDAAFQAIVLQTHDANVSEYVRLREQAASDLRTVRAAVNAIAHPGKLRTVPAGARRGALSRLHELAMAGAWSELDRAARQVPELAALHSGPALKRLARTNALLQTEAVRRYQELREQHGPAAGTDAAAAQGRASARLGEIAEHETLHAFRQIAASLTRREGAAAGYRVVRGLLTPQGFPGDAGKAKEEWDAAIVQETNAERGADIVLLAEVKSSPAAATPDFSRLHRGLQRLAQADPGETYAFASADGTVHVAGESLRGLAPQGRALPPHVIYCCSAPAEPNPPVLGAASKAVLLAERASLAFAHQLARGESPVHADLAAVWEALPSAPRLRAALHQYETARVVREAMLHPHDLLADFADAS